MHKSNKRFERKTRKVIEGDTSQVVSNRYLCPYCNCIISKQGMSYSQIICPNCGRLMTRITFKGR